jgi:hypothetical protein
VRTVRAEALHTGVGRPLSRLRLTSKSRERAGSWPPTHASKRQLWDSDRCDVPFTTLEGTDEAITTYLNSSSKGVECHNKDGRGFILRSPFSLVPARSKRITESQALNGTFKFPCWPTGLRQYRVLVHVQPGSWLSMRSLRNRFRAGRTTAGPNSTEAPPAIWRRRVLRQGEAGAASLAIRRSGDPGSRRVFGGSGTGPTARRGPHRSARRRRRHAGPQVLRGERRRRRRGRRRRRQSGWLALAPPRYGPCVRPLGPVQTGGAGRAGHDPTA